MKNGPRMMSEKAGYDDRSSTCAGRRPPSIGAFIVFLVLRLWPERYRQRARLRELDADRLRDIGIDRTDALREARKPFWR